MPGQLDRIKQQANKQRLAGNLQKARALYEQFLAVFPTDADACLDLGDVYMRLEDFEAAARLYAKMLEKRADNPTVLSNLGGALLRQGRPEDARAVLEYALELDPKNIYARINLGGVLQSLGELRKALENALEAVAIDPSHALAFNNLGSAFSDLALFAEAKHAFETAAMLDPKSVDALINLAGSESKLANHQASIDRYEQVLAMLPPEAVQRSEAIKFFAAFEYLQLGKLEKGWDYYEGGFSPLVPLKGARHPRRQFSVARWNGEMLNGKTLLVWREQGLGDELLFATCLHELQALGGKVIVECDKRLVEPFTRSFPQYTVRAEAFLPDQGMQSPYKDFDLHVPLGSLMKYFRRDIKDFERSGAYIKTDLAKVAKFAERLAPYKEDYRLVGICWRSGKLDPVRNLGYTTLDEWGEVLQTPGFKFVNLQYGDCEAELQQAEEKYGVEVLRWSDLNLKDDLDDVFALMHCLDAVASVQTAVLVMGGSVGVPSVGVKAGGWTNFGQLSRSPWNAKNKVIHQPADSPAGIYELGALELLDQLLESQPSADTRSDLRTRLSSLEVESLKNLLHKIVSSLEQRESRRLGSAPVIQVLRVASEVNYQATQPLLNQAVQTGILLKGTSAHSEKARFYLDVAATAGKEGDWVVAEQALQVAEDLDREQLQLRLPEYAWLKFLDGKINESTELAVKALAEVDWPTAAKFHLPRLLAEGGDYDAAFTLADMVTRSTQSTRGVYSAIAESALTDSKWERMLEAYLKEESLGALNGSELSFKSSAILRLQGAAAAFTEVKNFYQKAQQKNLGVFSALALGNMHKISTEELFKFTQADKSCSKANVNTYRAELIHLELNDETTKVDRCILEMPPIPTALQSLLYGDLCLASLIRGKAERGWKFLSRLDTQKNDTYLLRNIIEYVRTNEQGAEEKILAHHRKNAWFWRNSFLLLNCCRHAIERKDFAGLHSRDQDYRRYADLGLIYYAARSPNFLGTT